MALHVPWRVSFIATVSCITMLIVIVCSVVVAGFGGALRHKVVQTNTHPTASPEGATHEFLWPQRVVWSWVMFVMVVAMSGLSN